MTSDKAPSPDVAEVVADLRHTMHFGHPQSRLRSVAMLNAIALIQQQAGTLETVTGLLRAAMSAFKKGDTSLAQACAHAALDFASNDTEALAEGRLWADPEPSAPPGEVEASGEVGEGG